MTDSRNDIGAPYPQRREVQSHDPLCRQQHWDGGDCFDCRLIAKIRADERDACLAKYWAKVEAEYDAWRDKYRADLRAKVEALRDSQPGTGWIRRRDVLTLIDGGKPMKVSLCGEADCPTPYEFCEACVRADERKQYQGRRDDMMRALSEELLHVRTKTLADLRAKVAALPEDAVLYRGNILDLIAGISDE